MQKQVSQSKAHIRRKRADTQLIFDPTQKVPDKVLDAIVERWLVPALIELFLQERGITRESLGIRYCSR